MEFEWDAVKAAINVDKHGVTFDEGATVFLDMLALSGSDPDHSEGESRYITFGLSSLGNLLTVSHTHRAERIRIISVRRLTRAERKFYEKAK
jgi:uncharacterized protein